MSYTLLILLLIEIVGTVTAYPKNKRYWIDSTDFMGAIEWTNLEAIGCILRCIFFWWFIWLFFIDKKIKSINDEGRGFWNKGWLAKKSKW